MFEALSHKLGVGTLPSGLNRVSRRGVISDDVKAGKGSRGKPIAERKTKRRQRVSKRLAVVRGTEAELRAVQQVDGGSFQRGLQSLAG